MSRKPSVSCLRVSYLIVRISSPWPSISKFQVRHLAWDLTRQIGRSKDLSPGVKTCHHIYYILKYTQQLGLGWGGLCQLMYELASDYTQVYSGMNGIGSSSQRLAHLLLQVDSPSPPVDAPTCVTRKKKTSSVGGVCVGEGFLCSAAMPPSPPPKISTVCI